MDNHGRHSHRCQRKSHMIMEIQLPSLHSMLRLWVSLLSGNPKELLLLMLRLPLMYGELRVPRSHGSLLLKERFLTIMEIQLLLLLSTLRLWPGLTAWKLLDLLLLQVKLPPMCGEIMVQRPHGNLPLKFQERSHTTTEIQQPLLPSMLRLWVLLLSGNPKELPLLMLRLPLMHGELRVPRSHGNLPLNCQERSHTTMETQLPLPPSTLRPWVMPTKGKPAEMLLLMVRLPPTPGELRVPRLNGSQLSEDPHNNNDLKAYANQNALPSS